ncbi:MAG: 3-oxoacyl-[acyl-carrier-protein] reductase [Rhodothermia bacterium]|nr:MAG: 3-oxoacyl-[acyl-carrier-protein] reductase [Rhodothermia bacterium]
MDLSLKGKNVLITGGSRGIGKSLVEAFAAEGARVAFTYRSSTEQANALVESLQKQGAEVMCIQGDAADATVAEASVNKVLSEWETLDILVNNAGITRDNLMLRSTEEDWDAVLDTNLKSVYTYCKAVYRPMMKQRSGRIINMSSVVGVMGNPGQTNYAASKAGIIGLSKSLAKELGRRGITVNVVAPGFVSTEMTEAVSEAARVAMLASIPLGKPAMPEDVANAVLFLASDHAAYITGHVLHVDGGLSM